MEKVPVHVLLIEDNPADVIFLHEALDQDSLAVFHLSVVESLAEALESLAEKTFDAALLDLGLPDSQGLPTFLNFHQAAPALPVVVLSALDDDDVAQQAIQAGAQDFLVKRPREFPSAGRAVRYAIERQKSEQRFQALVTASAEVLYQMSPDWEIMNQLTSEGFLAKTEEPDSNWINKYIHPDDQTYVKAAIQEAIQTKSVFELEHRLLRADGSFGWTFSRAIPILDADGVLQEWFGAASDITARKQAEESLRENEALLRQVLNNTPDSVFAIDRRYRLLVNNPHHQQKLIASGSHPLKLGDSVLVSDYPQEMLDFWRAAYDRALQGEDVRLESSWTDIHGQQQASETSLSPLRNAGGEIIGALIVAHNISEQKQAQEKLRASEVRARAMLDAIPDMMIRLDRSGVILDYKADISELFVQATSLIGQRNRDITPPEFADQIEQKIEETLASGQIQTFEYQLPIPNQGLRDFEARMVPSGSNEVTTIIRNITDRKQAELALQKSERLLRLFVEHSPAAIAMFDRDMRYIVASHRYLADYRLDRQNLVGRSHYEVFPEMGEARKEIHRRCLAGDIVKCEEDPLLRADGTLDWVRYELRPWYEAHGVIGGVIFFSEVFTERKQAEIALVESELRLRMALETTSDGFWIVDANRRFLEVNPAYCVMAGYTREEFLQMSISDVEVLEDIEATKARIRKIKQEGNDRFETRHRRKDGSIFDVEVSVNLLDPSAGLMICFCRDITERKSAEQDAAYRQEQLQKVIQLGKKITGITDMDQCLKEIYHSARFGLGFDRVGLFLYNDQSQSVRCVYGTTRAGEIEIPQFNEAPVDPWYGWGKALQLQEGIYFTEDYQQEFDPPKTNVMYGVGQHAIVAAWSGEKPLALLTTDNLLTGRKIKPADLEALQLFAGYVGLAIENARLHTDLEKKVKERTTQVQDLYDNAPAGYHSLDANGCFTQINQTELNWLGYSQDEVIGRLWTDFITDESIATFRQNFPGFKQRGWVRDLEFELIRKDGTTFTALISATAIYDIHGNYMMSRSTVLDITERKKADQALHISEATLRESEAQLRASRDQLSVANEVLEKAARMKDEFLASMSHELRTPLTGILGLSEGLQEEVYGELNENQRRAVSNIETSGRHLLDLINDILDVSKLEAGMLELQLEPCILTQVCQASLQLVKGMAQKKSQKLSFAMTPKSIILLADSRRLKQVIVNLLSNAVKYTPVGGSLGLEVEGHEKERTIQISVWDDGIGIKAEDIDRLFQPFVQIDSSLSREQTGTGLGLTLVQHLVELHGGSLSVQSTYGEGSRFTVTLPWVSPPTFVDAFAPAGQPTLSQPAVLTKEKDSSTISEPRLPVSPQPNAPLVVIVDDNETNRTTLIDFLSAKQFRVAAAVDAGEFFRQLSNDLPDLVLMDIQMPGMDGLEAIRRVRAHPNAQITRVPIIALTALAMPGDRERCIAAGANEYLSKPVRLKNLATIIETLVNKTG